MNKEAIRKALLLILDQVGDYIIKGDIKEAIANLNLNDVVGELADESGIDGATRYAQIALLGAIAEVTTDKGLFDNVATLGWPLVIHIAAKKGIKDMVIKADEALNATGENLSLIYSEFSALAPMLFDSISIYDFNAYGSTANDNEMYYVLIKNLKDRQLKIDTLELYDRAYLNLSYPGVKTLIVHGDIRPAVLTICCDTIICDSKGKIMNQPLSHSSRVNKIDFTRMGKEIIIAPDLHTWLFKGRGYFVKTKLILRKDQELVITWEENKKQDITNHIERV